MRLHVGILGFAWLLSAAAGCDSKGHRDGTRGELGRVEFSYRQSCFFGCPLEQPLLVGASERIAMEGAGDAAGLTVESSAEAVAAFALERECYCARGDGGGGRVLVAEDASCAGMAHDRKHCDNTVLVDTFAAGEAALALRDADGGLVDRATITVAEAARAQLAAALPGRTGAVEVEPIELPARESAELELTLYDAAGRVLLAPAGVTWRVDDVAVASLSAWLVGAGARVDAGLNVVLEGVAAGETELVADAPGAQAQVLIRVVP